MILTSSPCNWQKSMIRSNCLCYYYHWIFSHWPSIMHISFLEELVIISQFMFMSLIYSGTTKNYTIFLCFWDLHVLESQLYFAFCRQIVENKVVEIEPQNSSLPSDDMSAMKYASPFKVTLALSVRNLRRLRRMVGCLSWLVPRPIMKIALQRYLFL